MSAKTHWVLEVLEVVEMLEEVLEVLEVWPATDVGECYLGTGWSLLLLTPPSRSRLPGQGGRGGPVDRAGGQDRCRQLKSAWCGGGEKTT